MARFARTIPPVLLCLIASASLTLGGCTTAYNRSLGGETEQVFARVYLTDFNTAWQSVLDSLKHARLDISNREAGFVQTKWADNTAFKNMIDSYGTTDTYLKAQYRFRVTVASGSYEGRPGVKISVHREQVVSRDVLEGFRPVESDGVDERTLLYRIGRIIYMRMKLALIEERRTQKAINESGGGPQDDLSTPAAPDSGAPLDSELNGDALEPNPDHTQGQGKSQDSTQEPSQDQELE